MEEPRHLELLCAVLGQIVGVDDSGDARTIRFPRPWMEADYFPAKWGKTASIYAEFYGSGKWSVTMEVIEACRPEGDSIYSYDGMEFNFTDKPFVRATLPIDNCVFEFEGEYQLVFYERTTKLLIGGRRFWVLLKPSPPESPPLPPPEH